MNSYHKSRTLWLVCYKVPLISITRSTQWPDLTHENSYPFSSFLQRDTRAHGNCRHTALKNFYMDGWYTFLLLPLSEPSAGPPWRRRAAGGRGTLSGDAVLCQLGSSELEVCHYTLWGVWNRNMALFCAWASMICSLYKQVALTVLCVQTWVNYSKLCSVLCSALKRSIKVESPIGCNSQYQH